jgi:hypothetical protein
MRLYSIELTEVGPFDSARLDFQDVDDPSANVTLLTGRNGTGKTIILDAIRAIFGEPFVKLERDILRRPVVERAKVGEVHRSNQGGQGVVRESIHATKDFQLPFLIKIPGRLPTTVVQTEGQTIDSALSRLVKSPPPWIVDYWRSQLANDAHTVTSLAQIDHKRMYEDALQGNSSNASVTQLLCHFDYLRDSRTPKERVMGERLYALAEKIVRFALLDGEFVGIERTTFTPRVRQGRHTVPLANVSSGNAYLIQRLIGLLGRMYSHHFLLDGDPATLHETAGLLLIDEAENHLHPTWQKRFIPGIREIFPNLQIIAATHSPFVVASVPDARVYVCRYDDAAQRTTVSNESAAYANKPVEEILASAAFDETMPFNEEISRLLDQRRDAMNANNAPARDAIEAQLVTLNPTYFGFLDLERKIAELHSAHR